MAAAGRAGVELHPHRQGRAAVLARPAAGLHRRASGDAARRGAPAKEAEAAKAALVARDGEPSAELKLNQDFPFARQQEQGLFVEAFRKLGLPVCLKPEEAAKLANPQRLPECVTS
jgi:hypothetical protein